jgi:hypothetical protein
MDRHLDIADPGGLLPGFELNHLAMDGAPFLERSDLAEGGPFGPEAQDLVPCAVLRGTAHQGDVKVFSVLVGVGGHGKG